MAGLLKKINLVSNQVVVVHQRQKHVDLWSLRPAWFIEINCQLLFDDPNILEAEAGELHRETVSKTKMEKQLIS